MTHEESEPDEKLMRSIEEMVGISEGAKAEFRQGLFVFKSDAMDRGEAFDFKSYPPLQEAIEKKLIADFKNIVSLTLADKSRRDPKTHGAKERGHLQADRAGLLPRVRGGAPGVRGGDAAEGGVGRMALPSRTTASAPRGRADAARHPPEVREAIRKNLPDIISDEAIITRRENRLVQGPHPRAEELPLHPRRRQETRPADSAAAKAEKGKVVGQRPKPGPGPAGHARGRARGRLPGDRDRAGRAHRR